MKSASAVHSLSTNIWRSMALLVQTAAELREAHEARDEEISQAFNREMKRLEDLSSSSSLATDRGWASMHVPNASEEQ